MDGLLKLSSSQPRQCLVRRRATIAFHLWCYAISQSVCLSRKRRNDNKEAEMRKRMDGGNNPQVESATLFINGQAPTLSVNGMSPYYTDRNRLITILDFRKRPAELSWVELSWVGWLVAAYSRDYSWLIEAIRRGREMQNYYYTLGSTKAKVKFMQISIQSNPSRSCPAPMLWLL